MPSCRTTAILLALACVPISQAAKPALDQPTRSELTAPDHAAAAARALIARVVPAHAAQFSVEIIPAAENGRDVFEMESVGGKVVLRGNTGVAVASALNRYLKDVAHCHLSWCGDRIDLPATLAPVPAKLRVVTQHPYRVMFNYCTLNYTCSWWDQARWERELDFLAMQGVNTPLGVIGLEAVWYDSLLKHGFSDTEARSFLIAPAHSAWQWMTNLENLGAPMPRAWIERQRSLGKWWMNRARSLGMTPIRQGFSGYVPALLKQKRPQAAIAQQPSWCAYPGSSQLDPLDPLFKSLGRTFMQESVRNFGEGHLWAADPFHESSPPKPGDAYLNDVGTAIFSLMREVDPKATWAMQSWSLRKPITDSVPKGALLVLDLAGNRDGFWGHNYVKGQLHNFGGRINLHGDVREILTNKFAARAKQDPQCLGMGLFPEAIGQNPVFYEAVYDMIWRDQPADSTVWLHDYALRRYGIANADAQSKVDQAWQLLVERGPYTRGTSGTEASSMIAARPALLVKKSGPNTGFVMPYKPENLVTALDLLLSVSTQAGTFDAYRYDIVDLTRQVLSNLSQSLQAEVRIAYLKKDRAAFTKATAEFETLLEDVDRLLATRPEFLYGKWLADARALGTTPEEKAYFEHDAAMLVTIWGPESNPIIFDYSWREWSGLIAHYYLPRWKAFHQHLAVSIERGDYRDPKSQMHGRESFRANDFYKSLATQELAFINTPATLPSSPQGDAIATAQGLLEKYRGRLSHYHSDAARAALAVRINEVSLLPGSSGVELGKWNAKELTADQVLTLDVSQAIAANGSYEIRFQKTSGKGAASIGPVVLTLNGDRVTESAATFVIDNNHPAKSLTFKSGENLINGKYELKVTLQKGATDSGGTISAVKAE